MTPRFLIEAYMSYHECDETTARSLIALETKETRLATYLTWEGIIGFTGHILAIIGAEE